MSGGYLNYFYSTLEEHVGDFGDVELDDLVADLAELFHDREWYQSGDTGEGDWNESREKFKSKWFSQHGRQTRIETYLAKIRDEVLTAFGIGEKFCRNCKHWEERRESVYGKCDLENSCLVHRGDHCARFEEGQNE